MRDNRPGRRNNAALRGGSPAIECFENQSSRGATNRAASTHCGMAHMIVLFGTERAGFRGATWRRLSVVRRVGVSHFGFGQFRGGLTDYGMMHTRKRGKHDQRDHAEQNAEDSGALSRLRKDHSSQTSYREYRIRSYMSPACRGLQPARRLGLRYDAEGASYSLHIATGKATGQTRDARPCSEK